MNLKPNEDGEYAEVQKQISMFKTNIFLFCQGRCLGAFYADISNGGSHQWAILYSSCTGLYHIGNECVIAARFVIGQITKLIEKLRKKTGWDKQRGRVDFDDTSHHRPIPLSALQVYRLIFEYYS